MAKWIIVVDDDTANLKIAGHILSKNNMRVTALKSGKSFLEYVDGNGMPDRVLLDIMMPEMDGFETLRRLLFSLRLMKMLIRKHADLKSAFPILYVSPLILTFS